MMVNPEFNPEEASRELKINTDRARVVEFWRIRSNDGGQYYRRQEGHLSMRYGALPARYRAQPSLSHRTMEAAPRQTCHINRSVAFHKSESNEIAPQAWTQSSTSCYNTRRGPHTRD